jgi:hypothetical protein
VKPSLPIALNNAAALLGPEALLPGPEGAAPAGADAPLAADLPFVRAVLIVAAKEYEQCAARRVREIAALSALLAKGAALPGCPVRAPEPPASLWEADLRISALDARLDALRSQLIDLQAWLEDDAAALSAALPAALRREITAHLHQTASRDAATLSSR